MAVLTADFEAGTNGSTILIGDAGSASAFDTAQVGGGTLTYDTSRAAHGTKSAKVSPVSSANYVGWAGSISSQPSPFFGRFYVNFTSFPTTFVPWFSLGHGAYTSGTMSMDLDFGAASGASMRIVVGGNTASPFTFTTTLSANQWYRIEYSCVPSATVGQAQVKLYSSPDSITAAEDSTLKTGLNTLASPIDHAAFGTAGGAANSFTYWFDNIVTNATAFPGPFPVSTTSPTVSGSTPVGSLLTCDGGTWNSGGTFTLAYQWKSAGSNVGTNSSTYTTVVGDLGNAISCTVTATGVIATNETASQASSNTITPVSGFTAARNVQLPVIYAAHISQN